MEPCAYLTHVLTLKGHDIVTFLKSWDVTRFLSVITAAVYYGLFGVTKMCSHCLRMIKGEFQICFKINSGFHLQLS